MPPIVPTAPVRGNALTTMVSILDSREHRHGTELYWWVGRGPVLCMLASVSRAFHRIAITRCEWCTADHDRIPEVFGYILGPERAGRFQRPLEPAEYGQYLTFCVPCILLHSDNRIDQESCFFCWECRAWIRRRFGCEHRSPPRQTWRNSLYFDPLSD